MSVRETQAKFAYPRAGDDDLHSLFSYSILSLLQDDNIPTLAREGCELRLAFCTHPKEYYEMTERYCSYMIWLEE